MMTSDPTDWKFDFDFYEARNLGKGSSGSVLEINQGLVIKIFSEDEDGQLDFERELSIYGQLQNGNQCKYIVKFLEVWEE